MSASIEWGHTQNFSAYILEYDEEAGDHQRISDDSDNPNEVGLMMGAGGDGFCLVGEPVALAAALAEALQVVTAHIAIQYHAKN